MINNPYHLTICDDIRKSLIPDLANLSIYFHETIDSTNNEAKRLFLEQNCARALILAGTQTCGRGRRGRSFYSPSETGLYMTFLFPSADAAFDYMTVTAKAAVAVYRSILSVTGHQTDIKWVNDIYYSNRKICGILSELVQSPDGSRQGVIVGIGINLTTEVFPAEIQEIAGSLAAPVSKAVLCSEIVNRLFLLIRSSSSEFLTDYRNRSCVLGKRIRFGSGPDFQFGRAVSIDDKAGLRVILADGSETTLRTGEISIRFE